MFWFLIGIGGVFLLVFMMAICKAAGDADRRISQMYWEQKRKEAE
jgi:hypothetical protein